jgi:hypothetical protein
MPTPTTGGAEQDVAICRIALSSIRAHQFLNESSPYSRGPEWLARQMSVGERTDCRVRRGKANWLCVIRQIPPSDYERGPLQQHCRSHSVRLPPSQHGSRAVQQPRQSFSRRRLRPWSVSVCSDILGLAGRPPIRLAPQRTRGRRRAHQRNRMREALVKIRQSPQRRQARARTTRRRPTPPWRGRSRWDGTQHSIAGSLRHICDAGRRPLTFPRAKNTARKLGSFIKSMAPWQRLQSS